MTAFLPTLLSAAASAGAGLLGSQGTRNKKVKPPKFQRELIDQLVQGVQGGGPLASLFSPSQEAFQTSVVNPAMNIFRNQIAPGIQQSFIAQGQQRGTPLETALSRSGTNVMDLILQQYLPFLTQAQNRQQGAIGQLLGIPTQRQAQITPLGGALSSLSASGTLPDIISGITSLLGSSSGAPSQPKNAFNPSILRREGFSR